MKPMSFKLQAHLEGAPQSLRRGASPASVGGPLVALLVALAAICLHRGSALADPSPAAPRRLELVAQAGLIQPVLLGGGNLELDVAIGRWIFAYSHGFQLHLEGSAVVGDAKEQKLAFELPFSTGVGFGYRVLDWLDLRAEAKWHRFKVRYADETIASQPLFQYDTFTLGAGAYAHWRPFRTRTDWLRGWNLSASLRWWPKVATTLDDDQRSYDNLATGEQETHQAQNIGIANTPIIANVSLGYAFDLGARLAARAPESAPRWGLETELVQPFIPGVHIGRLRASRTLWGQPSGLRGDLLAGVYLRPDVDHDIVDTIDEYLLSLGYRQYFVRGLHADVALEAGWVWGHENLIDGKDYSTPVLLLDANLGYRIDLLSPDGGSRRYGIYLSPQAGVLAGLATDIGPRGGKSDVFLQGKLLLGLTL